MAYFKFMAGHLGFLAVAFGAFGAHAFKENLVQSGHLETWDTATLYLFVHALALFVLSTSRPSSLVRVAGWSWFAGSIIFSGSLYVLSLTGLGFLGAITPIGGLLFLVGWFSIILLGFRNTD